MKTNFIFLLILLAEFTSGYAQDSALHYFKKGIEEKSNKRYLIAAGYFDKAIKFNPKYIEAYIENGYVNLEMRRTDAAKNYFTRVTELDPNNTIAIQEVLQLYYNYHQYQKAIEYALKCKSCDRALKIAAMSNYQLEDYTKAEELLIKYFQKNTKDAEACYTLARTYEELGDMPKAMVYFEKSIQLEPAQNIWMYELAILCYNSNDYANAILYFNKAAANGYPQNNEFRETLGITYLYAGNYEAGEKVLFELMAKTPGNKKIIRMVVDAYYQKKNYDKALAFCQKLLELDSKDANALYQAGLCFQKKGQIDRGQQMCDKAIEMDPALSSLRKQKMSVGL